MKLDGRDSIELGDELIAEIIKILPDARLLPDEDDWIVRLKVKWENQLVMVFRGEDEGYQNAFFVFYHEYGDAFDFLGRIKGYASSSQIFDILEECSEFDVNDNLKKYF